MTFPFKIIDLTHTITPNIPTWDGGCGFEHNLKCNYGDCDSDTKFKVQNIKMQAGIGIDALSPDRPEDDYPVHKIILEAGKYIIEKVANAHLLLPIGSYSLSLPLKNKRWN